MSVATRRTRRLGRPRGDRGSATAELAAALPALMVLLIAGLSSVEVVLTQMRCVDAARDAALAAARDSDGIAVGRARAPQDAIITITNEGQDVRVTVRVVVHPLGSHLPGIVVSAVAVADHEPGFSS